MTVKTGKYQHYKGNYYEVIGTATHSESMEVVVVYKTLYGNYDLWVRPLDMFTESIEIDGELKPRFAYVDEG